MCHDLNTFYLITTTFAVNIGIVVAHFLRPGDGFPLNMNIVMEKTESLSSVQKVLDTLLSIIPDNAIGAMANGSFLQVVFFSFFAGIVINSLEAEYKNRLSNAFQLMSILIFKMVHYIIKLAPIAACMLVGYVIGTQGFDVLNKLLQLITCAYFAFIIQYALFGLMIFFIGKLNYKYL